MCEFLKVNVSKEQRDAYSAMFARIALHRMGQSLKDSKDKNKDWAYPKCCSIYGGDKKLVPFDDFLKTLSQGQFSVETDGGETLEIQTKLRELSNAILEDVSSGLPSPLLQSVQIMMNVFTPRQDVESLARLAKALTRTFYLSASDNYSKSEMDNDILFLKPLFGRGTATDIYFSSYFAVDYFLSLLAKQNVCPHLPQFSAFVGCLDVCPPQPEQPFIDPGNNLRLIHMYEFPMRSVQDWITEPTTGNEKIKFQLKRPTLLEVENVLFQMCNTIYCLNAFSLAFNEAFIELDEFFSTWRCFTCQKITGYDRYKTLDQVFYVPNYGNFVVFHPNVPTNAKVPCLRFNTELAEMDIQEIFRPLRRVLTMLLESVTAWTEPPSSSPIARYPYEFKINYEQEMEPTKLIVYQKNEILQYLNNFIKQLRDMDTTREFQNTGFEIYGRILKTMFPSYKKVSSHKDQDTSDLTLMNDYGFNQGKFKVTRFVSEIIYELDWKQSLEARLWNPTKLMDLQKSGESLTVSPDVLSIAASLEASVGKPRSSQLLNHLKTIFGEFLKESNIETSVTDRYMVDASQLALRKSLRRYGLSFLTLMDSLDGKSTNQDWWNLLRLRDVFSDASNYVSRKDPFIQAALRNILKANQPSDLNRFLSTLMFLTYLQRFNPPKPEEKKGGPETKVPSLDTLKENLIKEFAELIGISEVELKADLDKMEAQYTLPTDVKSELTYLSEKLARIISKSKSQGQLRPSQDTTAETERQKSALLLIKKSQIKKPTEIPKVVSPPISINDQLQDIRNEFLTNRDRIPTYTGPEPSPPGTLTSAERLDAYADEQERLRDLLTAATSDEDKKAIQDVIDEITQETTVEQLESESSFFTDGSKKATPKQLEKQIQLMQKQLQSLLIQQKQMSNK